VTLDLVEEQAYAGAGRTCQGFAGSPGAVARPLLTDIGFNGPQNERWTQRAVESAGILRDREGSHHITSIEKGATRNVLAATACAGEVCSEPSLAGHHGVWLRRPDARQAGQAGHIGAQGGHGSHTGSSFSGCVSCMHMHGVVLAWLIACTTVLNRDRMLHPTYEFGQPPTHAHTYIHTHTYTHTHTHTHTTISTSTSTRAHTSTRVVHVLNAHAHVHADPKYTRMVVTFGAHVHTHFHTRSLALARTHSIPTHTQVDRAECGVGGAKRLEARLPHVRRVCRGSHRSVRRSATWTGGPSTRRLTSACESLCARVRRAYE
jgi:hypothetical protein